MPTLNKNPYVRTNWKDHIVDPTQVETDDNGDVIIDKKTGKPMPLVIQEGTRFTASRANNMENGIYNAYNSLVAYADELEKTMVQVEMTGRAPINNGSFYTTLDSVEGKSMSLDEDKAVAQLAYGAVDTNIKLNDVPFKVGEYVTIYDDEQSEDVQVTAVSDNSITVTALSNSYKKGAQVARSNAVANTDIQELTFGAWGTYKLTFSEVV